MDFLGVSIIALPRFSANSILVRGILFNGRVVAGVNFTGSSFIVFKCIISVTLIRQWLVHIL